MRKASLIFTLVFLLLSLFSMPASAQEQNQQQGVTVVIDGLPVNFDVQPVIQNGRTLVPFRAIAEALKVEVAWDGTTQTVSAWDGKTTVRLQIGSPNAYCNDELIVLDVPPQILNQRTLIPVRFFSEAFNCIVSWDGSLNCVRVISPPREMDVTGFYALGNEQASSWTNLFGRPYPETSAGNTGLVDELALGWYSIDEEGNLLTVSRTGWQKPDGWEDVLKAGKAYKLRTEMVIHVTDGDNTISSFLNNEKAVDNAVKAIVKEVELYDGVNLDFEGLGYLNNLDNENKEKELKAVQDSFTYFVRLLSERVHEANKTITATLHAPNSVYLGYDYKALGGLVDKIIIMAYDYGTVPEPVNLVMQAVEMALEEVPPDKLVLGISVPSETADSILSKIGIVKRYNLKGIALWRLGLISGEMWDALSITKP